MNEYEQAQIRRAAAADRIEQANPEDEAEREEAWDEWERAEMDLEVADY